MRWPHGRTGGRLYGPPCDTRWREGSETFLALRHSWRRLYLIVSMWLSGLPDESTRYCYP